MSRTAERASLDPPTRFILIEGDADRHEVEIKELSERLTKILWVLIGILVTTTSTSIALVINLVK